ncbi:hypothetical protein PT974_05348 [Cladobotryum mycophilum]|uniref:Uncharacterized protein n=1 Tax=Cladobotryum mycophilum TaxID=491253 RepID=A0ABR0SIK1_9HYPO
MKFSIAAIGLALVGGAFAAPLIVIGDSKNGGSQGLPKLPKLPLCLVCPSCLLCLAWALTTKAMNE